MVDLFGGNFYVVYSRRRYLRNDIRTKQLLEEINSVLGKNAIPFDKEVLLYTNIRSYLKYDDEKGRQIPITFGLIRQIWSIRPDVLISEGFYQWTPLALLYAFVRRKPVYIGYERTCYTERNRSILLKWHRKLSNLFVTGYLVNGTETKKYLLTLGIDERKIHVVGMSADASGLKAAINSFSVLERQSLKTQYTQGGLIFLFVGQIVKRKGLSYLLKAWEKHAQNYTKDSLIVVGTGDLLELYKKQYSLISSIYFLGRVDYKEVYKYYAISDVFILPTLEDNWSLVIPEAMACGLPVATSIYNGCHTDLIENGVNGYCFDPLNTENVIDILAKFHHSDLVNMGAASIEKERPYNVENSATRVYNAIRVRSI